MTEQEKIQELLKPRFKVIADYPGSDFEIGNILTKAVNLYEFEIEPGRIRNYSDHMIESYPHLFKRLEWHEDRKPEEMPEYVRTIKEKQGYDEVMKVESWELVPLCPFAQFADRFEIRVDKLIPATLTEYQQYINSKQQP